MIDHIGGILHPRSRTHRSSRGRQVSSKRWDQHIVTPEDLLLAGLALLLFGIGWKLRATP